MSDRPSEGGHPPPISVSPRYLAFMLTYRCPARCEHCSISADINRAEELSKEQVLKTIEQAAVLDTIELVVFTGGEPLLCPGTLRAGIEAAARGGYKTRLVSSAFWARTKGQAERVLSPLAASGLCELVCSLDDSHVQFVPHAYVQHAFHAAQTLGVDFAVNVCIEPGSRIDRNFVEETLGLPAGQDEVQIQESWINTTGRARSSTSPEWQQKRARSPEVLLGPCRHVLRGPTVTAEGELLPCCGTIAPPKGLVVGQIARGHLLDLVSAAYDDPLLKWLAFEGPAAVLEAAATADGHPFSAEQLDGDCNACDVLFGDAKLLLRARALARGSRHSLLHAQELLLRTSGMFRHPGTDQPPKPAPDFM